MGNCLPAIQMGVFIHASFPADSLPKILYDTILESVHPNYLKLLVLSKSGHGFSVLNLNVPLPVICGQGIFYVEIKITVDQHTHLISSFSLIGIHMWAQSVIPPLSGCTSIFCQKLTDNLRLFIPIYAHPHFMTTEILCKRFKVSFWILSFISLYSASYQFSLMVSNGPD